MMLFKITSWMGKRSILEHIELMFRNDYELSWLITDKKSFEWVTLQDFRKIYDELLHLDYTIICLGWFEPYTKETKYEVIEVTLGDGVPVHETRRV